MTCLAAGHYRPAHKKSDSLICNGTCRGASGVLLFARLSHGTDEGVARFSPEKRKLTWEHQLGTLIFESTYDAPVVPSGLSEIGDLDG